MKKIRLYPSGHEVECEQGQTVLSALEKAGYALPNNCRAGACGECKIKVREGEFDQGMVLSGEQKMPSRNSFRHGRMSPLSWLSVYSVPTVLLS
jgi:ferredoxin